MGQETNALRSNRCVELVYKSLSFKFSVWKQIGEEYKFDIKLQKRTSRIDVLIELEYKINFNDIIKLIIKFKGKGVIV